MATLSSFTRIPEGEQYTAFQPGPDDSGRTAEAGPDYAAIRRSPEFLAIRRRLTRFIFPMVAVFFCWYMTYVLLAAYAHGLMSHRVVGSVTVGLLLGLSQFVTTVLIMLAYVRFARKKVDPQVAALRERTGAGRS
ncbi:MAG TPA: DUF485 domain-containing protein [Actinophytocola sp.]|uniref:DUF485 domain-containing protein n=1 Tax=Actinophytocola sp. TaxID=1872138 RepID=UPI002DDD5451|nr:DUF485 domain-containing protein [Actinophytocola sp.]HEV2783562.1 DUF485 domain-containing protein [Actinophytocola sp.]